MVKQRSFIGTRAKAADTTRVPREEEEEVEVVVEEEEEEIDDNYDGYSIADFNHDIAEATAEEEQPQRDDSLFSPNYEAYVSPILI